MLGKIEGLGVFRGRNGDVYEGAFKCGLKHGIGLE